MKWYKKIIIIVFGVFVAMASLMLVKILIYEHRAQNNVENCDRVNIGMHMVQVVEVMGEPDHIYTYQARINYTDREVINYYYDAPSGSSVGVEIYFDVESKKVVRIECKD